MTERAFQAAVGAVSIVLFLAAVTFGVKVANGALSPRYQLEASFAAAGQGLQSNSDVKIHGVNVGRVKSVRLLDGRARVRMDIDRGHDIPVASRATIRPKTLFGEKFVDVDPGDAETSGPFLADEGVIRDTVGGFELERVLSELYPILQAVEPDDLLVVIDTLAAGGRDLGPAINRQIVNFAAVARIQARHDTDTRQFLDDFAELSDELALRAEDIVAGARSLNRVLPTINARGDELGEVLDQTARLSGDLADVLQANQPFLRKAVTEGGKTVQALYDERAQIAPLIVGLRQYFQVLGEVGRIPYGDGTLLAAVKFVVGEDAPCGRVPAGCAPTATGSAEAATTDPVDELPAPTSGELGVIDLVQSILG